MCYIYYSPASDGAGCAVLASGTGCVVLASGTGCVVLASTEVLHTCVIYITVLHRMVLAVQC